MELGLCDSILREVNQDGRKTVVMTVDSRVLPSEPRA